MTLTLYPDSTKVCSNLVWKTISTLCPRRQIPKLTALDFLEKSCNPGERNCELEEGKRKIIVYSQLSQTPLFYTHLHHALKTRKRRES